MKQRERGSKQLSQNTLSLWTLLVVQLMPLASLQTAAAGLLNLPLFLPPAAGLRSSLIELQPAAASRRAVCRSLRLSSVGCTLPAVSGLRLLPADKTLGPADLVLTD